MEMSRSPRSAHLQMREDRRQEQLQRAREKDRLKEMQAKLERHLGSWAAWIVPPDS